MSEEDVRKWNEWFYTTVKEMRRWQALYYKERKAMKDHRGDMDHLKYYLAMSCKYESAIDAEIQRIEAIKKEQMFPSIKFDNE